MKCFSCGLDTTSQKYGLPVCESCVSDLRLFTDETIIRINREFKISEKYNTLHEEVSDRLNIMEKDYLKKRIKLLHIADRIEKLRI